MLTAIPVTLITAAGCALINLWLSIRVGKVRRSEKISIGDGGSEPLIRQMRAQANFVENAPFVLMLILALEVSNGTSYGLWAASVAFLVARVMHPLGMDGGSMKGGRSIGTGVTFLVLIALSLWAVVTAYSAERAPAAMEVEAISAQG